MMDTASSVADYCSSFRCLTLVIFKLSLIARSHLPTNSNYYLTSLERDLILFIAFFVVDKSVSSIQFQLFFCFSTLQVYLRNHLYLPREF